MSAKPWVITISACLVITFSLTGIKFFQISKAVALMESFPPPYETITLASAVAEDWQPTRLLSGTVQSPQYLVISAEAPGRIVGLPYQSGDAVPMGEKILMLFDDDVRAERDALNADLELVKAQLLRNLTLEAESLVSQNEVDILRARKLSLDAQVAALNAKLSRMSVHAPFTGKLGVYSQRLGDLMRFGEVLTTLTGVEPTRWVDFKVPQGLANIAVGDRVEVRNIDGVSKGPAKVIAVSEALAQETRTYDVRAEIEAPTLRHGSMVQVLVNAGPPENLISVPKRSVRWDPEGPYVYVIKEAEPGAFLSHRASVRRVEVRGETQTRLYLRGEVLAKEIVANKGAFKLEDGILVSIKTLASET